MKLLSVMILPFLIAGVLLLAWTKNVNAFEAFTVGAKRGAGTILEILPSLIGLFAAIAVLRASGAMTMLTGWLAPVGAAFGIDRELLPLALMRPISGSASLAMVEDVVRQYGPDTYLGKAAAVMMGSTETIFYTMAVYMGGSGIRKAPGVLPAALAANLVSAAAACFLCRL